MKTKFLVVLGVGVLGAMTVGAVALSNSNYLSLFSGRATGVESGSYTLTAADFVSASGNIEKGGEIWHYDSASVSGNVVTVDSVMYTTARSGSFKTAERRGDGYTRMVINGLDKSGAVGLVFHETDTTGAVKKGGNEVLADVDLTFGGTVASADRRGLYFAQSAGSSFSFTSMTLYYGCTDVQPEVTITTAELSVGVGENGQVLASASDIFGSDTVSYAWSSDDNDVATVAGNSLTGTVTGIAAGTANITVTMTVNGVQYHDSLEVTVTAAAAEVIELGLGEGSNILGNQVFTYFDTTSTGLTAAQITAFGISSSEVTMIDNTIQSNEIQSVEGNTFRIYSPMQNGAVGLTSNFKISYDFRDNVNNKIYRGTAYYSGGEIAKPIVLTAAAFSVEESADLEITASKAFYFESGSPTFTFVSLDTDVFTVSAVGAVATVTGVAEGSATLRVTMTINEQNYVLDKQITVTEAGVQHLVPWYTEGTGNQRNHLDGAGVWTWVKYGDLGYDGFGAFSAKKGEMTATYSATSVRVEVISDDNAGSKYCRVYLVLGAAVDGKLTLTMPDANGVTYTGTITFVSGEATSYND